MERKREKKGKMKDKGEDVIYDEGFKHIYREIQLLEKQISPTSSNDGEDIQLKVRSLYEKIIFDYPDVVTTKNIYSLLWKNCFHRRIESLRHDIKKISADLDPERIEKKGDIPSSSPQSNNKERLLVLNSTLERFLAQTLAFYQKLLLDFKSRKKQMKLSDEYVQKGMFSCLLYMGDVARYAQIYSDFSKDKDWKVPARYYERARRMNPNNGNPYNQLAVLASYDLAHRNAGDALSDIELTVVYYYCRSILIPVPFQTGVENLKKIYEKNYIRFSRQSKSSPSIFKQDGSLRTLTASSFLTRFLYLHGLLFYLASSSSSQFPPKYDSKLTPKKAEELIRGHYPFVMDDFERLLHSGQLGEEVLMRLLAICLFSVQFSEDAVINTSDLKTQQSGETGDEHAVMSLRNTHTTREYLSLLVLYSMIKKTCQLICPVTVGVAKKGNFSSRKIRCLQIVSIFCDWGRGSGGAAFLQFSNVNKGTTDEGTTTQGRSENTYSSSSLDLQREVNRSRSALWVALTALRIFIGEMPDNVKDTQSLIGNNTELDSSFTFLPEHLELQGYLPLQNELNSYFCGGSNTVIDTPEVVSSAVLQKLRCDNICTFVDNCILNANRTQSNPESGSLRKGDDKVVTGQTSQVFNEKSESNLSQSSKGTDNQCKKSRGMKHNRESFPQENCITEALLVNSYVNGDINGNVTSNVCSDVSNPDQEPFLKKSNVDNEDDEEIIVFKPLFAKAGQKANTEPSLQFEEFPSQKNSLNISTTNDYFPESRLFGFLSERKSYDEISTNNRDFATCDPQAKVTFAGLFGGGTVSYTINDCHDNEEVLCEKSGGLSSNFDSLLCQSRSESENSFFENILADLDTDDNVHPTKNNVMSKLDCPPGFDACPPGFDSCPPGFEAIYPGGTNP